MTQFAWHLLFPFISALLLFVGWFLKHYSKGSVVLIAIIYLISSLLLGFNFSSGEIVLPVLGSDAIFLKYLLLDFSNSGLFYLVSSIVAILFVFASLLSGKTGSATGYIKLIKLLVLVGLVNLFFAANNLITLYISGEIMTFALLAILVDGVELGETARLRGISLLYLLSSLILLCALILLAVFTDHPLSIVQASMSEITQYLPVADQWILDMFIGGVIIAAIIRMGVFPFQQTVTSLMDTSFSVSHKIAILIFVISGSHLLLTFTRYIPGCSLQFLMALSVLGIIGVVVSAARLVMEGKKPAFGYFWSLHLHLFFLSLITANNIVISSMLSIMLASAIGYIGYLIFDSFESCDGLHANDGSLATSRWLLLFTILLAGIPFSSLFVERFEFVKNIIGIDPGMSVAVIAGFACLLYFVFRYYLVKVVYFRDVACEFSGYQKVSIIFLIIMLMVVSALSGGIKLAIGQHLLLFVR